MQNQKTNNSAMGAAVAGAIVGAAATVAAVHLSDKKNRDALAKKAKDINKDIHQKYNEFAKETKGNMDEVTEDVKMAKDDVKDELASKEKKLNN